jgi:hypothetical protein
MKARGWVCGLAAAAALALALAGAAGCGRAREPAGSGGPTASPGSFEFLVGDWQNKERMQAYWKVVIRPDRVMEQWVREDAPSRAAELDVRNTWVDAEGGTCCQFLAEDHCYGKVAGMIRVDAARKVLEYNMKSARLVGEAWPEKIDSRSPTGEWTMYLAYSRK